MAGIVLEIPNPNYTTPTAARLSKIKLGMNLKHRKLGDMREARLPERTFRLQGSGGHDTLLRTDSERVAVEDLPNSVRCVFVLSSTMYVR
jgi:hypothetical protein